MIPYDIDPSLHATLPGLERLDDGFSPPRMATHPVEPEPGLEKEEPEQVREDDIPADDGTTSSPPASKEERPLRQVERE